MHHMETQMRIAEHIAGIIKKQSNLTKATKHFVEKHNGMLDTVTCCNTKRAFKPI